MNTLDYQIVSTRPIVMTLPRTRVQSGALLANRALAVALAAKSRTFPPGGEISVIHVPTGEILFSKISGWGESDD